MKHGMNRMKWMVVLMFFGAAFNVSAVLIAAESFQTSVWEENYSWETPIVDPVNQKVIIGNIGFSKDEPWTHLTGAVQPNGSPNVTTHDAIVPFVDGGEYDWDPSGNVRITPGDVIGGRNSRRRLATTPPLSDTYFLSGLVRLGSPDHLVDGQDLSWGFLDTISTNEYKVTNGMHFGVRKHGGTAYLTASAAGNTYDLFDLTGHDAEVFQIVLRLDVSAAGNETFSVWYAVDGATAMGIGLGATSVETWSGVGDLGVLVGQVGSTTNVAMFGSRFDEVRLGTEWADVTLLPDPGLSGAYEAWIGSYPSAGAETNRTDNPDGDSLNNLYEWGLGGDPTNSADIGHVPTYGIVESGGTNWLEYVYAKFNNAGALGLAYYLELNPDLISGTWTNSNYSITGAGVLDGEFNAVTNVVPTDIEDVQFLRLIIQEN